MRLQEFVDSFARDCIHYNDSQPCREHLATGALCRCQSYAQRTGKVLFIQLSSPETVIRSNALLYRLKQDQPGLQISYLTEWPELLGTLIDEKIRPDGASFARLQGEFFDGVYNLDPSRHACAVMNLIPAEQRAGFALQQGLPQPLPEANALMVHTLIPNYPAASNRQSLRQAINDLFIACNLEYDREMPRLNLPVDLNALTDIPNPICLIDKTGPWPFSIDQWTGIINRLEGTVVLLGDETSGLIDRQIAKRTRAHCPGSVSMNTWLHYAAMSDLVVTRPGWQAEAAWALDRQIITVQAATGDRLYQTGDFPTRMTQLPMGKLSMESFIQTLLENLISTSFDPDGLLARMRFPEKLNSAHTIP